MEIKREVELEQLALPGFGKGAKKFRVTVSEKGSSRPPITQADLIEAAKEHRREAEENHRRPH